MTIEPVILQVDEVGPFVLPTLLARGVSFRSAFAALVVVEYLGAIGAGASAYCLLGPRARLTVEDPSSVRGPIPPGPRRHPNGLGMRHRPVGGMDSYR